MSSKLVRQMGLMSLILYGVGDILGAGVYGLVGKVAGELGSASWLAFLISAVAAGLTGLSYASLGSRYPKAGGATYVTYRAFGKPFLSYVVGLAILASGLTSMATASRIFAGYFVGWFEGVPQNLVVIIFALALGALVFWGLKESLWLNLVCTLIELGGLLLILFTGLSFVGEVSLWDAKTAVNPEGALGAPLLLTGAVLTFYSFIGFEDILNVAEEVKEPRKTIPLGLLIAVAVSSVIYMGISVVAVSVVPAAELAGSTQPLVDVAKKSAPWFPSPVFSLISMFAVMNTALLNLIMGSRLVYGMADQGLLPKALGEIHDKRKTPHRSILVLTLIFLVMGLSGDVGVLARSTSVLLLLCFTLMNVSLFVLKGREKGQGSFEVPRVIPILGALVCAAMLTQAQGPELLRAGLVLILVALLYFIKRPDPEVVANLKDEEA